MIVNLLVKDSATVNTQHVETTAIFDTCIDCNLPRIEVQRIIITTKSRKEVVSIVCCACTHSLSHEALNKEFEIIELLIERNILITTTHEDNQDKR